MDGRRVSAITLMELVLDLDLELVTNLLHHAVERLVLGQHPKADVVMINAARQHTEDGPLGLTLALVFVTMRTGLESTNETGPVHLHRHLVVGGHVVDSRMTWLVVMMSVVKL